jgi:hypothetical protein
LHPRFKSRENAHFATFSHRKSFHLFDERSYNVPDCQRVSRPGLDLDGAQESEERRKMSEAVQVPQANRKSADARLESVVLDAYRQSSEWPLKVAAGIYAAIEFTVDSERKSATAETKPLPWTVDPSDHQQTIERLAELLRAEAPRTQALPADTAVLSVARALIADSLRRGRLHRLTEIGPDLVQLVLLPYLGFAEAKRWATSTAR